MKKTIITIIAIVIGLGVIGFIWDMSIDNKEIKLREKFFTNYDFTKTEHDAMWKIISQQAEISQKYADEFKEIYPTLISGRYEGKDPMFNWIQEHNPTFSVDLYAELMKTIKNERTRFKNSQNICRDVSRQYTAYLKSKPQIWLINKTIYDRHNVDDKGLPLDIELPAYEIMAYKPVTSTKTEKIFEEGIDDDVKLF